ncbi:LacI family transcriptional regulator [Saccharomonospora piscinae]|uniref:LacI family DNA-binding transcriptional regulator n=1 Tax=Saccharomonospora piscinae TaxID=687388 RepID=UPI0011068130|nr:LacI family DNA-binding transcriptional regulator [Saccharomonospora piscinae]TLW91651.1 LacI family transcriptional regulator [Saccharomonospora piscinae]
MATIYDVARHAEVSVATVSRVLNGSSVDPAMAERVTQAVTALRYRPNLVARNLRTRRTRLWAVIISDVRNPFFTDMVRGIEDVASAEGYSVVLCNSDEDAAKEADYVDVALAERMAGVILSPSSGRTTHINSLVGAGCPVVLVDRELGGVRADAVLTDNEQGAALATRHLVEQGFERIACVTGPQEYSTAAQRLRGYRAALAEAGRDEDESLVRFADFREPGGHAAMTSLLDSPMRPDAVFAANNLMTIGVLRCLAEHALSVPADVGVVGFDELPWAEFARPTITTVGQPTYDEGRAAAEALARRIGSPDTEPTRTVLSTSLNVRESSLRER